jgi:hypothetical protein
LVNEAVFSANGLAGATSNSRNQLGHDRAPSPNLKPTHVQHAILQGLTDRVLRAGPMPDGMSEETALTEMVGNTNLYTQEAGHLASFDISKIKVLQRDLRPQDARSLCPPAAAHYLKHYKQLIERDAIDLNRLHSEGFDVQPYWDPVLKRSRGERCKLYAALFKAGLLSFRRKRKATVAFFVVKKKDGMQRLIVDARIPNLCHKRPPKTRLATPAGSSTWT